MSKNTFLQFSMPTANALSSINRIAELASNIPTPPAGTLSRAAELAKLASEIKIPSVSALSRAAEVAQQFASIKLPPTETLSNAARIAELASNIPTPPAGTLSRAAELAKLASEIKIPSVSALSRAAEVAQQFASIKLPPTETLSNAARIAELASNIPMPPAGTLSIAAKLAETLYSIQLQSLAKLSDVSRVANKALQVAKDIESDTELEDSVTIEDIEINQDGSVSLGAISVTSSDLSESLNNLFADTAAPEFFENFVTNIKKLSPPLQAIAYWVFDKIIIAFIIGVFVTTYSEDIQVYLNQFEFTSKRSVTQQIKKIPTEIDITALSNQRVVTGERLRLRKKPNRQAEILCELPIGKLVYFIMKKKDWTFIEIRLDDNGQYLQGWVFSRYLTKIKR